MTGRSLDRVALAISSFRSDEAVLRLLETAFSDPSPRFGAVIVVDSLGSGRIGDVARERGWPVRYESADRNLGSAGNLALRLRLAARTGLDWCLALNHDAMLDAERTERLLACGSRGDKVGAVYPQLRFTSVGEAGRFDRPRRGFTLFGLTDAVPATGNPIAVRWGSSNGALYRLDAVRTLPSLWDELWMGYEDLALGWELHRAGWAQRLCSGVVVDDNYEFRPLGKGALTLHSADKPVWYSYYQARNPLLIARRTGWGPFGRLQLLRRLAADLGLVVLVKGDKRRRLSLLWRGLVDGWNRRGGKGSVP